MPPKVFVSHASEDKARFVLSFAEKLRQNGVDAWLDKWEMLPGDSLVDKIFEEGLKDAKAVVVVLSKTSVEKPWVREELNAAVVKRINSGSKLIPVVIDNCEVPEVLKPTLWERIEDLDSYQPNLDRILAAIFGVTDKPEIGSAPAYIQSFVTSIGGLNKIDSQVLKLACDHVIKSQSELIDPSDAYMLKGEFLVPETELVDSMEILDQQGYISILRTLGGGLSHFRVTTYGFDRYATTCIANYQEIIRNVVSAIVNKRLTDNIALEAEINQPRILIDHILDVLESNSHLKQSKSLGGMCHIYNVSPSLKRALNG